MKSQFTLQGGYILITGMNFKHSSQPPLFPVSAVSNHGSPHRGCRALVLQQVFISFYFLSKSFP